MEDVQYMREHGVEEAYLLLVDSAQRDLTHDKHPAEYDVVFTTPFRNVVGVDIVTASIPRTQYVVENNNNRFAYKMQKDTDWRMLTLPTGDYPVTSLINVFNNAFAQSNSPLQIQALSQPATLTNKIQLYSTEPFQVNMSMSTLRRVLGFNEPPTPEVAATGCYDMPLNYVDTDPDVYISNASTKTGIGETPAFAGPQATDGNDQLPLTSTVFARNKFTCIASGSVTAVALYANILGTPANSDEKVNFCIIDVNGNLFAKGTVPVPNPVQPGLPAYLSDSVTSTKAVVAGQAYYIVFFDADVKGDGSDNCYALYATELLEATTHIPGALSTGTGSNYSLVTWQDHANASFDLCVGVQVTPPIFQVTSPGLTDLTGERYINIRCSQIEDHIFGARAYEKHNVGMAKIDLGVFGYSDSRFDFSGLPPRRFHPIAKLNRLTFRFERGDRSLYDFKGVDHTMILSIRYLVPDVRRSGHEKLRLLNPQYNPNLQQYVASHLLNYRDAEDAE